MENIIIRATFRYFSQNPDAGIDWIKAIIAESQSKPADIMPVVKSAIDCGIAVAKEQTRKPKAKRAQKAKIDAPKPVKPTPAIRKGWKKNNIDERRELDKRMEEAYLGEVFEIKPEEKPVKKELLTPAEKRLYDYMVAHPDHTKPRIEKELLISEANYYYLKGQLKKKGWISNGVVEGVVATDPMSAIM